MSASLHAGAVTVTSGDCCPEAAGGAVILDDEMSVVTLEDLVLDGTGAEGCGLADGIVRPPKLKRQEGSRVQVFGNMRMERIVDLHVSSEIPLELSGDFDNQIIPGENQERFADCFDWREGGLLLSGEPADDVQTFEVGGTDLGPLHDPFSDEEDRNFEMGLVEVAPGANVTFRDTFVNTTGDCEALYLKKLILREGAAVMVDDCKVYYQGLENEGVTPIILPGCGALLPSRLGRADFKGFASDECFRGPGRRPDPPECRRFDYGFDEDVDLADFAIFERSFVGPQRRDFVHTAKLLASDGAREDYFGSSVAVSGDIAVVGVPFDDDRGRQSGSAYIYRYDGSNWVHEQKLVAADGKAYDSFGESVAVSDGIALVGAKQHDDNGPNSGSAYVFRYDGSRWVQEAELLASDGEGNDRFGWSVAAFGDTAVIGAPWDGDNGQLSGSAYVFRFDGFEWFEQAKLLASDGAATDDDKGDGSGSAYVFRYDGSSWIQEAKLLAGNGKAHDQFGNSVAVSDGTAVVGAWLKWGNAANSGSAYVFRFDDSRWVQEQELLASDGAVADFFGTSVAISGNSAAIGAPHDDDKGFNSGSAYVFSREVP